jgi:hypothetical protein
VYIFSDVGKVALRAADERSAQGVCPHRKHGSGAQTRAATKQAAADDPAEGLLWAQIVEELRTIKAEALRADRVRG